MLTAEVAGRVSELEATTMDMSLGMSQAFESLKKIAAGDPTVKISIETENELLKRLEEVINETAGGMGEIVDQSHEMAMVLCDSFEILNQISQGNLTVRAAVIADNDLLARWGEVTNPDDR